MIKETALKKTTTLKDLERVTGTEGSKDYFVLHSGADVSYCLKVDFSTNFLGHAQGIFSRVRIVKNSDKDIFNMTDWFYDHVEEEKLKAELKGAKINCNALKRDMKRISFVCSSTQNLADYGEYTEENYPTMCKNLDADLKSMGTRIYKALRLFKEPPASLQKVIHQVMSDFAVLYAPPAPPKEKKKPVTKAAKEGKNVVELKPKK